MSSAHPQDFAKQIGLAPAPVPILVLSLRRAAERRAALETEMTRYGLHFRYVDAIDAAFASAGYPETVYDPKANRHGAKRPLSPGEVACALGHRAIWAEIATGPHPVALVCEDDMTFTTSPGPLLAAVAAAPGAFEDVVIKLDGHPRGGKEIGRIGDMGIILTSRPPPRTTGYLIGRRAARQLLIASGLITRPVDNDLKRYWEHGVTILATRAPLIVERPDSFSYLSNQRQAKRLNTLLGRTYRHLRYQSGMIIGRLFHPLHYRNLPEAFRRIMAPLQ